MGYKAEYEYFIKVLERLHFQVVCMSPEEMQTKCLDFGLRKFLGLDVRYADMFGHPEKWIRDKVVYKMTDEFLCRYIFFKLPDRKDVVVVGPYSTFEKTKEQMLEEAERYNVPAKKFRQLEACHTNITVVNDEAALFALINTMGDVLWGEGSGFEVVDFENEANLLRMPMLKEEDVRDPEEVLLHMKSMEDRYAYENELIDVVSRGLSHKADMMLSSFSKMTVEQRSPDAVRNVKNYCIICNTLLRKAAERGGVHPVHIDSASSMIARRIEEIATFNDGKNLMKDIANIYCRLVKKHSAKQYAPFVRKTVAYIESDLSGDLRLSTLAALQNVNASYLSTLFHRETGKTVTEFVNEKRMDLASRLLRTTQLQVQTVARYCGISDVNYFSKIFKKFYGMTPKQYRDENKYYMAK